MIIIIGIYILVISISATLTGIWFNITPDYNPTEKEKVSDKKISKGIGIFWIILFLIGVLIFKRYI